MLVYLRDRSAQTILLAPTLNCKLQIKLSASPSHSILTPGLPVPALTPAGSHWSANFEVTGMTRPGKIPSQLGFEPRIFRSRGGHLNHQVNEAVSRMRPLVHGLSTFSHSNLSLSFVSCLTSKKVLAYLSDGHGNPNVSERTDPQFWVQNYNICLVVLVAVGGEEVWFCCFCFFLFALSDDDGEIENGSFNA